MTNPPLVVGDEREDRTGQNADGFLVYGDWVGEGGFCIVYELRGIRDLDRGEWILEPPSGLDDSGRNRKAGAFVFSLTGRTSTRTLPEKQRSCPRHISSTEDTSLSLPRTRSVHLTLLSPLSAGTSNDSNSVPCRRKSLLRRSSQTSNSVAPPPYVLKCLKPSLFGTPKVLDMGSKDLQLEIKVLQQLRHPGIVSLVGHGTMTVDALPPSEWEQLPSTNNNKVALPFCILDRLGDTLLHRLEVWETKHRKHSGLVGRLVTHRRHRKLDFLRRERWQALQDLASALAYMHSQRIVYRDMKPENVAFDRSNDRVKLIDMGLVKDLKPLIPVAATGLYRLTSLTGSARYMAPEVARKDDYNESCDVYSLAIVIWQVMALQIPFCQFDRKKMNNLVYDYPHCRPTLTEFINDEAAEGEMSHKWLARLLSNMWHPLIEERPTMKEVHSILKSKLRKLELDES